MTYSRGSVVVASDPYGDTPRRPYLVLSDDSHPFIGEQYIAVGISTREYGASIPLADEYIRGSLTRESFASPWAVVSLLDVHIERAVAEISPSATNRIAHRMAGFTGCDVEHI